MRYKILAAQIVSDIQAERLQQGQRMPSLRRQAEQAGVSLTTALNCYRLLEEDGWLLARPQSGYYVSSPLGEGAVPEVPRFRSRSLALAQGHWAREEAIDSPLGISQLGPALQPGDELRRHLKRALQAPGDAWLQYSDAQGAEPLRNALAGHFGAAGLPLAAGDLVVRNGCIDAIRVALEVTTRAGDAVAISSPCFNGLLQLLQGLGRRVVEVPGDADGLDLAQLQRHLERGEVAACLFSSSHLNPQGISLPVAQKQALAELANRTRTPLIEDDIYADLSYDGHYPPPVKRWDSDGYVLWCSSFSKTLAAGLRLGWCSPGRYTGAYVQRARTESLACNSLVQHGLARFLHSGGYSKHLRRVRLALFRQACECRKLLQQQLPPGAAISRPRGGLVLWVQVPRLDARALQASAQRAGIVIQRGDLFSSRGLYRDCFRLNVGWPLAASHDDARSVEQALRQLCQLVREQLARDATDKAYGH